MSGERIESYKEKTRKTLSSAIERRDVVCLQEVYPSYSGEIAKLFEDRGYETRYSAYGVYGVMIAVPDSIIEARSERISKRIICQDLLATRQTNRAILVHAKRGNFEYVVATYHVPPIYRSEESLFYHIRAYEEFICSYNFKGLTVMTGDFNLVPESPYYSKIKWNHATLPEYTNWTLSFKNCIDYIFYRNGICSKIDVLEKSDRPYPENGRSSDHFPVTATLSLL